MAKVGFMQNLPQNNYENLTGLILLKKTWSSYVWLQTEVKKTIKISFEGNFFNHDIIST